MKSARRPRCTRRGALLIEIVVSTLIVSTLIVAALNSVGMVYRARRTSIDMTTGVGLARELLGEVLSMPYEDLQNPGGAIGLDSGESAASRATFDDLDDYNGFDDGNASDRSGADLASYAGWRQQVAVTYAQLADPSTDSVTDSGLKCVSVTITSPTGRQTQLKALRSRYGMDQQSLPIAANVVTWIGVDLKLGDSTRLEHAATMVANHADEVN